MFLRTSAEAQHAARHRRRQRITEDATKTLIARLDLARSKHPVAMYTLSARECKLITPINKRDPEDRRRHADPETVIRTRIEQLQTSVKYHLQLAGIKVNCEVISDIGVRTAGEKPRLLSCQIMVVRTDFPF